MVSHKQKIRLIKRILLEDQRGWFLKVLDGYEPFLPKHTGEIYITMANPGSFRANHYHHQTAEWFTVVTGSARVILEDIISKERIILELNENNPQTLFVPPGIAHVFLNDSSNSVMILIAYAENPYDPSDTCLYNLL